MKEALIEIFDRELEKLKIEIELYKEENNLWIVDKEISNSAGNLCLHLIGNLNHFIGAVLGKNGYVRQRDNEFLLKNIPSSSLINQIEQTRLMVLNTISSIEENQFLQNYPEEKHGTIVKMDFMLLHLLSHFNYHLGQINYHRRLLDDK